MKNTYPKETFKPGRIDLEPQDFDRLLQHQGTRVRITPAILCPRRTGTNIDETSLNHDLNCPLCDQQIIDLDDLAVEDWAFIQGITIDKTFDPQQRYDVKDAFISTRAHLRLAYWYKIEIIDFGSMFNELILRTADDQDHLRYPAIDPEDGSIFHLVDNDGTKFVKGTDFNIVGQDIVWLTANRPPKNKLYSFLYPVLPTFRVLELMHENRYYYESKDSPVKTPIQLPQQAHVRWDFMAKGSGSDVELES